MKAIFGPSPHFTTTGRSPSIFSNAASNQAGSSFVGRPGSPRQFHYRATGLTRMFHENLASRSSIRAGPHCSSPIFLFRRSYFFCHRNARNAPVSSPSALPRFSIATACDGSVCFSKKTAVRYCPATGARAATSAGDRK